MTRNGYGIVRSRVYVELYRGNNGVGIYNCANTDTGQINKYKRRWEQMTEHERKVAYLEAIELLKDKDPDFHEPEPDPEPAVIETKTKKFNPKGRWIPSRY